MSKFFDQYSSILEKNLQRVRLKVDPLNKYAEDFAQYNGYEGYILAETEDAIKFFSNNEIVMIPKKAVVVEGILSGLAGTAAPGDTSRRTAIGTIGRNIAGTAARAMFGSGVTGTGTNNAGAAGAQPSDQVQNVALNKQVGMSKIPNDMWGQSYAVADYKGTAGIKAPKNSYYITKISTPSGVTILENKNFNELLYSYMTLMEVAAGPGAPAAPAGPVVPAVPAAQQMPAQNPQAAPAGPVVPQPQSQQQSQSNTTNSPATSAAPAAPAKGGIRFIDITNPSRTKGIINTTIFITLMDQKTQSVHQGYGVFSLVPNSNNYSIAFAAQQP